MHKWKGWERFLKWEGKHRQSPRVLYLHFEVFGKSLQEYFVCEQCTAHQYLLWLKVPDKQAWNTHKARAELKKSWLSNYLLTTTTKHINESCTLLSSSSLCGHSPKRRHCDKPEESKAKHPRLKTSLTESNKCTDAFIPQAETGKFKRRKNPTFTVSEFLLLVFNGASVHL